MNLLIPKLEEKERNEMFNLEISVLPYLLLEEGVKIEFINAATEMVRSDFSDVV